MSSNTLVQVLSHFAHTLTTNFSIQDILDELVLRVVEVLPVTAAGVTLISPGMAPHYIAASDDLALRLERLQTDAGQGPCLLAYGSGAAVLVPDLAHDDRFPQYAPLALADGLAAVFAFPLRHGDGRLGALDLYCDTAGPLDTDELAAAQTLADVAAAYLLNAQAREIARKTSDHFRHSALHDALTGLPNRTLLDQRLEHAAERARGSASYTAVLFVDLDEFKLVNDTYGHDTGDALLRAVADRLRTLTQPGDTLARVYGDEFVFIFEDLPTAGAAAALSTRVLAAFESPFLLSPGPLSLDVTASIGLAYAGLGGDVTAEMLVNADIAMYQAKRSGGAGHRIIDLRSSTRISDRHRLRDQLAVAYAEDKLDLAYQPIIAVPDRTVTGVEALLRWAAPGEGPIPTHTMIEVAERHGLNSRIGAWVVDRACVDRRTWFAAPPVPVPQVSINVSTRQLLAPGFGAVVAAALRRTDTAPSALVLEFAGDIVDVDGERVGSVLGDLRALGVRLAWDNFGVGYSSLSHLSRFAIDVVKIDRSLVADVARLPAARAVVEATTHLAHALGQTVTAVGVETEQQHETIRSIGCDFAQGYLYARPMPAEAIGTLLARPTPDLVTL